MKKFSLVLIAMMLLAVLGTSALAAGSAVYDPDTGILTYEKPDVSDLADVSINGGGTVDSLIPGKTEGQQHVDLDKDNPGHVTIGGEDIPITIKPGTSATEKPADPTEKPADPTEKPADPTEKPADPTEKPADPTEKPADPTEKPADPTEKPADPTQKPIVTEKPTQDPGTSSGSADDDVPKTGDTSNVVTFVVIGAMVLAAAWMIVRRALRHN